jgi:two-component system, LytTR family, sensor kinase
VHTTALPSQPVAGLEPGAPRFSRALRALGVFVLWTALAGVFATQLYFAGLPWAVALAWTLPRWYSWGLVTPFIFRLDRRLAAAASLPVRVALHVPLALVWTAVTIALRLAARPLRGSPLPDNFHIYLLDRFYSDLPIYAVIAGVSFARLYAAQVKRGIREAHELALRTVALERRLVEARLQSLRAQLQPHFLFNALNTISAFTESNPKMARRLMAQLGDLLRASLRHTSQPLVTLGEELTFLDDFLAIESARFEGRLNVSVHADDELLPRMVPAFLLQPIVENAIRHGVGTRLSGGHVEVSITAKGRALSIHVRDDGVGLPPDWSFDRDAGVGLRNVADRLEQMYGTSSLLRITAVATGGVDAQIDLPEPPAAQHAEVANRATPE